MKKIISVFLLSIVILMVFYYGGISYGADKFSGLYNEAIEYYKQGKYDQAGKKFEEALDLKPNDAFALYGLGNTYYCKAKYDEAIKTYTKAINMDPDYAKAHYSLSLAYSKMGMTHEAEKEKKIFRKLSQGEKGTKKSPSHASSMHAGEQKSEHATKMEHEQSSFGLAAERSEKEHSDFGRTGQAAASESAHAQPEKHEPSSGEAHHVAEEKHAFGSKRSKLGTDKHEPSAEKAPHISEEKQAFGSKRSHIETPKKPGHETVTEQVHVAAEHVSSGHGEQSADHGTAAEHESRSDKHGDTRVTHDVKSSSSHAARKSLKDISSSHTIFKGYTKEDASGEKSRMFFKKYGKSYSAKIKPVAFIRDKWEGSRINKLFICTAGYLCVTQLWLSVIAVFGFIVWRIRKKTI